MLESNIQSKIIKALEKEGAYVVKVMKATKAGKHDLIVCYRGRFVSMECKQQDGKARGLQKYNHRKVEKAGGVSGFVRSVDDALALLRQVDFAIWGEGIIDDEKTP